MLHVLKQFFKIKSWKREEDHYIEELNFYKVSGRNNKMTGIIPNEW